MRKIYLFIIIALLSIIATYYLISFLFPSESKIQGDVYCLRIIVVDKNGRPIDGAFVSLCVLFPNGSRVIGTRRTRNGEVLFILDYREIRNAWKSLIKYKIKVYAKISILIMTKNGPYVIPCITELIDLSKKGPIIVTRTIRADISNN